MIEIWPAKVREALGLTPQVFIPVPPANSGGAGWKDVWLSLGTDNMGGPPTVCRVLVKREAGDPNLNWYPPKGADTNAKVQIASGRSFGVMFNKGDEGLVVTNEGINSVVAMIETAPR